MDTRQRLRAELKQRRTEHSAQECTVSSLQICEHIRRDRLFHARKRFALYYPVGNEVNLMPLLHIAWSFRKETYLPVLATFPKGYLWWVPYYDHTPLYLNKFQIPEPRHNARDRTTRIRSLDVIFMPLVGFDKNGNRMGMGGGFYDRSLAKCYRSASSWHRPLKIGVAYSWQEVDKLPSEKWDIPLDAIVTENGLTWF